MANLNKNMFREYDLRGELKDDQLNEQAIEIIAQAYGTMLRQKDIDVAVVGHDYREGPFRDEARAASEGGNGFGPSLLGAVEHPQVDEPLAAAEDAAGREGGQARVEKGPLGFVDPVHPDDGHHFFHCHGLPFLPTVPPRRS